MSGKYKLHNSESVCFV